MSTLIELLKSGEEYLLDSGIEDAKTDAWQLLSHVFKIDRIYFLINQQEKVDKRLYNNYIELILQRSKKTPLQYIIGHVEFMGINIKVTKDVLIPRQETEILVNKVLEVSSNKTVLDMCTGSACIIVSLAKLGNILKGVGVDISAQALEVARKNAQNNGVDIDFIQSDLFNNINDKFDIIVSNPPYIPTLDIEELMPEVRENEPRIALDGLEDGLDFYRRIINQLDYYLNEQGHIFFEIGYNQGLDVYNMLIDKKFKEVEIIKDLSGFNRIVHAVKI
ncbi:MAG TPA: peptide chain release factor N(5)-glutamine methyltransferase [Clostridiales bacterium]|nr:peptide chain release factor N(5)-glutamine methyltransferase [Clostridiales bacterium]